MTVTTINAVIADVMLMTELNWLLALHVLAGVPSGTIDPGRHEERCDKNKNCAEDGGSRQIVRAMTENLWHRRRKTAFRSENGVVLHECPGSFPVSKRWISN